LPVRRGKKKTRGGGEGGFSTGGEEKREDGLTFYAKERNYTIRLKRDEKSLAGERRTVVYFPAPRGIREGKRGGFVGGCGGGGFTICSMDSNEVVEKKGERSSSARSPKKKKKGRISDVGGGERSG